jgi:hypothetical protein
MNMVDSKKAQTEILGLAIVVVLLSFGLIMILSSTSNSAPNELKQINEELADKFINTLLHTSTPDCNYLTIQDLILDIASNSPSGSIICEQTGQTSFDYLNQTLSYISNSTIAKWKGGNYQLSVFLNKDIPLLFYGKRSCEMMGKEYPIPMRSGTPVIMKLKICQ